MLSDEDVLAAVRRRVEERGGAGRVPPGGADITRHLLIEGRVLRCVETRTEEERFHQGSIDLSDRPVYGSDLDSYRIPPPEDPASETTLRLVRRGSVDDRSCDCGNGVVACERCKGRGELPCVPAEACGGCRGVAACLWCDGTGHRSRRTYGRLNTGRRRGRDASPAAGAAARTRRAPTAADAAGTPAPGAADRAPAAVPTAAGRAPCPTGAAGAPRGS